MFAPLITKGLLSRMWQLARFHRARPVSSTVHVAPLVHLLHRSILWISRQDHFRLASLSWRCSPGAKLIYHRNFLTRHGIRLPGTSYCACSALFRRISSWCLDCTYDETFPLPLPSTWCFSTWDDSRRRTIRKGKDQTAFWSTGKLLWHLF
jgi:hypothetical protein